MQHIRQYAGAAMPAVDNDKPSESALGTFAMPHFLAFCWVPDFFLSTSPAFSFHWAVRISQQLADMHDSFIFCFIGAYLFTRCSFRSQRN